jgi:hypothetical protein
MGFDADELSLRLTCGRRLDLFDPRFKDSGSESVLSGILLRSGAFSWTGEDDGDVTGLRGIVVLGRLGYAFSSRLVATDGGSLEAAWPGYSLR